MEENISIDYSNTINECNICCEKSEELISCKNEECNYFYCIECYKQINETCLSCFNSNQCESESINNFYTNPYNTDTEDVSQTYITYLNDTDTSEKEEEEIIDPLSSNFSSDVSILTLEEKILSGIKIGCPNLGNTCYINSVLQIFLHSYRLFTELCEVIPQNSTILDLINQVRLLYTEEKKLNLYEQCDSYLLLSFLLDKINNLFPSKFNPYYNILYHSKIKCKNKECNHITHKRQCENIIYLRPHSSTKDIDQCLEEEFNINELEFTCPKCGNKEASKHTSIDNIPEHLFISLQHFGQECNFKINTWITQNGIDYELAGMVEHIGAYETSGHYVSYILQPSNKWYLFNDSIISEVDNIKEIKKQNKREYKQVLLAWYKLYRIIDEDENQSETKNP